MPPVRPDEPTALRVTANSSHTHPWHRRDRTGGHRTGPAPGSTPATPRGGGGFRRRHGHRRPARTPPPPPRRPARSPRSPHCRADRPCGEIRDEGEALRNYITFPELLIRPLKHTGLDLATPIWRNKHIPYVRRFLARKYGCALRRVGSCCRNSRCFHPKGNPYRQKQSRLTPGAALTGLPCCTPGLSTAPTAAASASGDYATPRYAPSRRSFICSLSSTILREPYPASRQSSG